MAAWRIGNREGKSRGKGSPVNGRWKESSDEDIRGIRSGAGNERKGGNAEGLACIISDKDKTRRIFWSIVRTQGSPRVRIGTELDNRVEILGEEVEVHRRM